MKRWLSVLLAAVLALSVTVTAYAKDQYQNNNVRHISVHDPSIFKGKDGAYYTVGSHLAMGKSSDLINWNNLGYSIDGVNYLTPAGGSWKDTLAEPLAWCMRYQQAVPEQYKEGTYEYNCWANNIIYNETMGKYCLYGCSSVWGTTASVIWLCTAVQPEGPYTYVGILIESGITNKDLNDKGDPVVEALDWRHSNVKQLTEQGILSEDSLKPGSTRPYRWFTPDGYYNCWWGMYPNAIDPTAFFDAEGNLWLVYGSFSGGCYLHKLDKHTGLIDYSYIQSRFKMNNDDLYYGVQLSRTNAATEGTGEGPFIVYDPVSGYYYFFLTYGGLAGDGGYHIREYRSKNPDGPYTDAGGHSAMEDGNTGLKLNGNYQFSCQPTAQLSGGHSSCLIDSDGSMYQAFHTRFACDDGWGHQMRVHKMARTADGWAVMLPYEYQGEKETVAVTEQEVCGTYELIMSNNMTQRKETAASPLSDIILPTQQIVLKPDHTIAGAAAYDYSLTKTNTGSRPIYGSWSLEQGTARAELILGSTVYHCVFAKQYDESEAKKEVMTFTGAGSDNATIWGAAVEVPAPLPETPAAPAVSVKTPKLQKLKSAKKAVAVQWKKCSGVTGYQVQYSLKKSFKGAKTKTVKGAKKTKLTLKKLKSKKQYYVRVRAYRTVGGKTYYSAWSKAKTAKVK